MPITKNMYQSPIPVLSRNSYITHSVLITISIYTFIPLPEDFYLGRSLGRSFVHLDCAFNGWDSKHSFD